MTLKSLGEEDWTLSLSVRAYGCGGMTEVPTARELIAAGNRLEYRSGDLVEWYINDASGLEQGFTIAAPPPGERAEAFSVAMEISGDLVPRWIEEGSSLALETAVGKPALRYAGLVAWDAEGRDLPVQIAWAGDQLSLVVDDSSAVYPVAIDPLFTEEAKLLASDGAGADRFSYAAAISGDTAGGGRLDDDGGTIRARPTSSRAAAATWTQQAKLTAGDAAADDQFGSFGGGLGRHGRGRGVAAMTTTAANSGSAYVFTRSGTSWTQQAKLTAERRRGGRRLRLFGRDLGRHGRGRGSLGR